MRRTAGDGACAFHVRDGAVAVAVNEGGVSGATPRRLLVALVLLALLVRVAVVLTTLDIPGDGPSRALEAYEWSRHPFVPTWGWWPPGFLFLSGAASLLVPQPLLASRLLDVVLGTLTVPVCFILVRQAFGLAPAIFGAAALALFPLHVELSASSLTEAGYTLEVLAGLLLMATALDGAVRPGALALALVSLAWASMTRYEAWWLLPLFPAYAYWRSRRLVLALLVAVALAAFPCAWMLGNLRAVGDPLLGFSVAKKGAVVEGVQAVSPLGALVRLVSVSGAELGWPLAAALLPGAAVALRSSAARSAVAGEARAHVRLLYLAAAGLFWAPMWYFAMVRGASLYSRYLLLGYVLALPWAILPFRPFLRRRPWIAAAVLLAAVASFVSTGRYAAPKYVTRREPTEVRALAAWLAAGPYRDSFVLLTDMGWDASYLALYWPEVAARRSIVSVWMEDGELAAILRRGQPALLVTRDDDREQQARIAAVLGADLGQAPVVHRIGATRVHDLTPLVAAAGDRERAGGRAGR